MSDSRRDPLEYHLCKAVIEGNLAKVKALVKEGAHINYRDALPVKKAIAHGHLDILAHFVKQGFDLLHPKHNIFSYLQKQAMQNAELRPVVSYCVDYAKKQAPSEDWDSFAQNIYAQHLKLARYGPKKMRKLAMGLMCDPFSDPQTTDKIFKKWTKKTWIQRKKYPFLTPEGKIQKATQLFLQCIEEIAAHDRLDLLQGFHHILYQVPEKNRDIPHPYWKQIVRRSAQTEAGPKVSAFIKDQMEAIQTLPGKDDYPLLKRSVYPKSKLKITL